MENNHTVKEIGDWSIERTLCWHAAHTTLQIKRTAGASPESRKQAQRALERIEPGSGRTPQSVWKELYRDLEAVGFGTNGTGDSKLRSKI